MLTWCLIAVKLMNRRLWHWSLLKDLTLCQKGEIGFYIIKRLISTLIKLETFTETRSFYRSSTTIIIILNNVTSAVIIFVTYYLILTTLLISKLYNLFVYLYTGTYLFIRLVLWFFYSAPI